MLTRIWDEERRRWRLVESLNFTGPHAEVSLLQSEPADERFRSERRGNHAVMADVAHSGTPFMRGRARGARRRRTEW